MPKPKQRSLWSMTRRLLSVARPVKWQMIISTLASVISNLAHMGLTGFGSLLIMRSAGITSWGTPLLWGTLLLVSSLTIAITRYLEGYISHAGAYQLLAEMRVKMFHTLRALAPASLMDRQGGDILSVAISDIETIEFFFAHTIGPIFTVILLPTVALLIAGSLHPLFVVVLLPIYLFISLGLPLLALRLGRQLGVRYRERLGRLKSMVLESVLGLRDIQIFGYGDRRLQEITDQTDLINSSAHALTVHRQTVTSAPTFFIYLGRILVAAVATFLAAGQGVDPVGVVVLSFVVSASFSSSQALTNVISSLLETFAAADRLFTLEDMLPAVVEKPQALAIDQIGQIRFEGVSFSYVAAKRKQILDKMDLTIHAGDKIGIVGESGIGKSTIIRLLLRFWDPQQGTIRVNGIPLTDLSLSSLRQRIAVLEQDTFLFDATIAENIALGRPDATREEISVAARRAGVHDFVQTLPDGYDTAMGEMGGRISGGEKQRIGIARTLLVEPDVLVMDEPTSSLDVLNEKGLLKTLEEVYRDKTVIIVSHRASTLTGCNRILSLQQGRLLELNPRAQSAD